MIHKINFTQIVQVFTAYGDFYGIIEEYGFLR